MNVTLSDDQRQLADAVTRLVNERHDFNAARRATAAGEKGASALWGALAEMGILSIVAPSAHGGFDGGAAELLPVMQAFGRALVLEPYLGSAVLATAVISACGNEAIQRQLLPSLIDGSHRSAFAHEELLGGTVRASEKAGGWQLHGRKILVLGAATADSIVVTARVREGADGMGLFWLSPDTARDARAYRLVDEQQACDLDFNATPAQLLCAASPEATRILQRALDLGTAAVCAEAAGAMRAALEITTAYLGTRKQFGKALSEFQVLRHRAAEMAVATETCEAMAYLAAIAVDVPDSAHPRRDLAQAKLLVGRHGRWVGEQAVHLHGGIGMTDEYIVGHYLQRLIVIDTLLGNQDVQIDALTAH